VSIEVANPRDGEPADRRTLGEMMRRGLTVDICSRNDGGLISMRAYLNSNDGLRNIGHASLAMIHDLHPPKFARHAPPRTAGFVGADWR